MRLLAPLRRAPVALLWGALSLSAVGDQLYAVAMSWIAVGVFGTGAGLLVALGAASLLAVALFGGRWIDGWDQRQAMLGADLLRASVLALVVLAWGAAGAPSAVALMLAVVVLGAGQAVFRPAMQALLPVLAEDARMLPAANALFDTTERIARLLGPGLVGVLAAALPARHFLSLDAASFLLSAAALVVLPRLRPLPPLRRAGPRDPVLRSVARGFRAMRSHPVLGFQLLAVAVTNGTWYAALFLGLPLLVTREGLQGPAGTGLGAYGLVISAYGCTNLLATLVLGSRDMPARPARMVFAGEMVVGGGLALMGLGQVVGLPHGWLLPACCAAAALAAPGGPMQDIPVAVLRQTALPPAEVPAAMRAYLVMSNGGLLAAMAVAPALFAAVPIPAAIMLCGLATVAVGAAGLLRLGEWRVRPAPRRLPG